MPDSVTQDFNNHLDAVIMWVDGADPELAKKRNFFLNEIKSIGSHGTTATFFASNNEIKYCVLSILKFAPYFRHIFIVTDGQDPEIYNDVEVMFPGRAESIKIVDHKEIFRGYEQYLPVFNSTSILSMIWRIKGLSEHFVCFSDDVFIIRDLKPEDWFINGKPVLRGRWLLPPYRKMASSFLKTFFNKYIKGNKAFKPRLSFYMRQRNAALLLGIKNRYFFHCHTPHPLNRKTIEDFFKKNQNLLEKNISNRFRSPDQLILTSLAYHLEIKAGNRTFEKLNLGYLHPIYSKQKLQRKIRNCRENPEIKFVCAQNLDLFYVKEREGIFSWLDEILVNK